MEGQRQAGRFEIVQKGLYPNLQMRTYRIKMGDVIMSSASTRIPSSGGITLNGTASTIELKKNTSCFNSRIGYIMAALQQFLTIKAPLFKMVEVRKRRIKGRMDAV
jgi:hypothetical protein